MVEQQDKLKKNPHAFQELDMNWWTGGRRTPLYRHSLAGRQRYYSAVSMYTMEYSTLADGTYWVQTGNGLWH